MKRTLCTTLGLLAVALSACGEPEPSDSLDPTLKGEIEDALTRFETDTQTFMNALPQKMGAPSPVFSTDMVRSLNFIGAKNVRRQDGPADAPGSHDLAKNLVDSLVLTNFGGHAQHSVVFARGVAVVG